MRGLPEQHIKGPLYEYLQVWIHVCTCVYKVQSPAGYDTSDNLVFLLGPGGRCFRSPHPQCSLVYLACIIPSVSVSPLVQKLRAGTKFPAVPQPHPSALLGTDLLSFCLSA